MKTPNPLQLALTMAFALAAACPGAFADDTSSDGRSSALQSGRCVVGTPGCASGATAMFSPAVPAEGLDPATEGVLVGMGAAIAASTEKDAAKNPRTLVASAAPSAPIGSDDDSGTDYAGIGSKIINPGATAADTTHHLSQDSNVAAAAAARPSFNVDAAAAPQTFTKASGFAYKHSANVEAATGDQGTGLGSLVHDFKSGVSDPKLGAANEDLSAGGTHASSNR
jgi:hypothetical protein